MLLHDAILIHVQIDLQLIVAQIKLSNKTSTATLSAYTEIICPCTTRWTGYKKYSPDALMPPSGSYSP
jgi:hypothetical protein